MDTLREVRELGGYCIAPHPTAVGMGMKTLLLWAAVVAAKAGDGGTE